MSSTSEGLSYLPPENPATETNTMAIVSLVTGVLGWLAVPIICGIIAVITGHIARSEIKKSGGRYTGDPLAIAGLILGYANLALVMLFGICFLIIFFIVSGSVIYPQ